MHAKYDSTCGGCGEPIERGEEIALLAGQWAHAECAEIDSPLLGYVEPTRPEPAPVGDPCPVCWLYHRRGACDR